MWRWVDRIEWNYHDYKLKFLPFNYKKLGGLSKQKYHCATFEIRLAYSNLFSTCDKKYIYFQIIRRMINITVNYKSLQF